MKRSLGADEWIRRGLGVTLLAGVAVIALGLDTGVLARLSLSSTGGVEQAWVDKVKPKPSATDSTDSPFATGADSSAMKGSNVMMAGSSAMMTGSGAMMAGPAMTAQSGGNNLPVENTQPNLNGAVEWLNSPPLDVASLRGKVVLVDFWTYSCINCLRTLPYVRAWAEKYKDQGLVVVGVHAPEFAFEKDVKNVRKAVKDLQISYPVGIDNNYAIWRAFKNEYWPAHYFIDAQGRIRLHHFGEGNYAESEKVIQQLLAEAGAGNAASAGLVDVKAAGAAQAPDMVNVKSPETYLGYARAENFVSPGGIVQDKLHAYARGEPRLNEWSLAGDWTVGPEHADLGKSGGTLTCRFHARDLHLVLGPSATGKPVRFQVLIDGASPGEGRGIDTLADGTGTVTGQRLYQLIRQKGPITDHTFEIRFLDPGVQVFAFTFG